MNKSKKITLKHLFSSFSSLSIKLLHIGFPIIFLYFLGLLYTLLSSSHLPSNVLTHLYLPSLEHIIMAFTIMITGALVADIASRQSSNR